MTIREAIQYVSQGWPHFHKWEFKHYPNDIKGFGTVYKCKCGEHLFITPGGVKKLLGK